MLKLTRDNFVRRLLVSHVLQQRGSSGPTTTGHQRGAGSQGRSGRILQESAQTGCLPQRTVSRHLLARIFEIAKVDEVGIFYTGQISK